MNHFQKTSKKLEKLRSAFFMLGLIIACSLTFMAFEWSTPIFDGCTFPTPDVESDEDFELSPITFQEPLEQPKVKIDRPKIIDPVINIVIIDKEPTTNDPVENEDPEPLTYDPNDFPFDDPVPMNEIDEPILIPGKMPEFMGGDEKLFEFLKENVKYPGIALNNGIEGTVYVGFTIGRNGKVRDVKIKRGINKLLDDEAIRVVKAMPKWEPGRQHGKKVSVYYTIPIKFIIS